MREGSNLQEGDNALPEEGEVCGAQGLGEEAEQPETTLDILLERGVVDRGELHREHLIRGKRKRRSGDYLEEVLNSNKLEGGN